MDASLYANLQKTRASARSLVRSVPPAERRRMHHKDLSPLLWHLGHLLYVEQQWIGERLAGLRHDAARARLFRPDGLRKSERGACMPDLGELAHEWADWEERCVEFLSVAESAHPHHPLLAGDFILHFLIQHHGQHLETMHQALAARALALDTGDFVPSHPLVAEASSADYHTWPGGSCEIGDNGPHHYDNERPRHILSVPAFAIAERPVSNAAYLGFMEAGGYHDDRYWTCEARRWRESAGAEAPWHWRCNRHGSWYGVDHSGAFELSATAPVAGLSAYEARAFARYARARLPHEVEWELGVRMGFLRDTGQVWEWCDNRFYPYPGFRAFPYRGYSMPWFDGAHTSLRGASIISDASIKRPSFRNFHTADKRHISAGIRLCRPPYPLH